MKIATSSLLLLSAGLNAAQGKESHHHHPPHNMILVGDERVFASHIVYKQPHNYQVILEVALSPEVKRAYLEARKSHPEDLFKLVLDPMDISQIQTATELSGTIIRTTISGDKVEVWPAVKLGPNDFKVLYFGEVPISLEALTGYRTPPRSSTHVDAFD